MAPEKLVLSDVLVVHETDLGWLCRVGGHQVFLARLDVTVDTIIPAIGERGTITIEAFAADRVRHWLRR
jgi:hypothetical protein